jgi:DNA-binding transcriptional LysR family regulator
MDLRHTRTFVAVAELGTVSKAALHLHLTQHALSRTISDFEHELGFKLFDRVGRRLLLTSEGEQLLGECRALRRPLPRYAEAFCDMLAEHVRKIFPITRPS